MIVKSLVNLMTGLIDVLQFMQDLAEWGSMGEDLEGWEATDAPLDGYASEGELDTRKLIAKKNRKNKKSGGFQVSL